MAVDKTYQYVLTHCQYVTNSKKEQAEAEVVPSSRLVKVEVDLEVEVEVGVEVEFEVGV